MKSLISPHFTSYTVFRERKEVLVTWRRWESKMKVEPERACFGVTEKSSSMPPVFGQPLPAFSLILTDFKFTFSGRIVCSCQNRVASAAEYATTSKISQSASPAPWTWICPFRADWRSLCLSRASGSMRGSRSIPPRPPLVLTDGGSRIFWGGGICPEWAWVSLLLH